MRDPRCRGPANVNIRKLGLASAPQLPVGGLAQNGGEPGYGEACRSQHSGKLATLVPAAGFTLAFADRSSSGKTAQANI